MKRNLLSLLFITATLGLIVILAFSNTELNDAWAALFTLDLPWVLCALLGWCAYLMFDMLSMYYFLRVQKYNISLGSALFVTLTGFYYSNITPGASGGQPMQVYYLSKRGVPVAIGTSAISIKFFAQQLMVVLLAAVFWMSNAGYVDANLASAKWAIYIGYAINFAAIPLILLVGLHRPLVQAVVTFFIRLGAKLKLVKHPEDSLVRINAGLDVYHTSILRLAQHPSQLIWMLVLAGLSTLGLMSVPWSVYHAFRMSGTPWHVLFTLGFLLFVSASYTPLPGASGAQEGGFLVFFRGLFTQGTIGLALLVWRFFTYYLFLLVGAVMSVVHNVRENRKRSREERAAETAPEADAAAAPEAAAPLEADAPAAPVADAPPAGES
ncbi:MAG: lysylphosphatidylglycerol synthase transmembrane domain-containing protein [Candidatus Limiplasma sp.]|nr:lysylphosphatidylglycerol synthase transmembrane domain-containing protein [Candidatus Limiplasma sp.]